MPADFEKTGKAQWLAQVETDLKGQALESLDRRVGRLCLSPFHALGDAPPVALPGKRHDNNWEIGHPIGVREPGEANAQALEALGRGAEALCFRLSEGFPLEALPLLLKDIRHEWISTHFSLAKNEISALPEAFAQVLAKKGEKPLAVACSFLSPAFPLEKLPAWKALLPKARWFGVDARPLLSQEGDPLEELTWALCQGQACLEKIDGQGLSLREYASDMHFSFSLSNNYFLNIAKIRAFRWLWPQVLAAWDRDFVASPFVEAHIDARNQTEDEHYNKIQAGAQAMAAAIGGIDRLVIHPSDAFRQEGGTAFSRRVALNIHHLLRHENYLDKVIDPASGSYFVDSLTRDLAEKAWKMFVEKENGG